MSATDDLQAIYLQHKWHAFRAVVKGQPDNRLRVCERNSTHLHSILECLCLIVSRLAYASVHDKDDEVWLCLGSHLRA